MDKVCKTAQNPTRWGGTYLYGLSNGGTPPPRGQGPEGGVLIPHSRFLRRRHPEKRFLSQPHIGAQILANPASPGS